MQLPLVFENEFLIVVDKPAGWLTTPARSLDDPRTVLGRRLQAQVGSQIYPVHRLDFEVSGLTLWAKDARSHTVAQRWFETAQVQKFYQAWSRPVSAEFPHEWVTWTSKLVRGKRRTFAAAHGLESVTRAQASGPNEGFLHWELNPVTGRPHQLRFEMAAHGFPIYGDSLYGGELCAERPNWIALRAVRLDFLALTSPQRLGLPETLEVAELALR